MSLLEAIVLGLVQGLTEFLPISSTAHLRIVPSLLGWDDPGAAFSAVIQLGTVVAVLVYFARDVRALGRAAWIDLRAVTRELPRALRAPRHEGRGVVAELTARLRASAVAPDGPGPFSTVDSRLAWFIVVGTVPIVLCGLAFKQLIHHELRSLWVIAAALIALALVLAWVERRAQHRRGIDELELRDALVIGAWQALALVPGSSRSGTTLTGGLARGLTREAAARFSFLLSIPATGLAGLAELKDLLLATEHGALWPLAVGCAVSFASGYAAIAGLLRFLRTRSTMVFVVYRLALGGLLIALLVTGRLDAHAGTAAPPSAAVQVLTMR